MAYGTMVLGRTRIGRLVGFVGLIGFVRLWTVGLLGFVLLRGAVVLA